MQSPLVWTQVRLCFPAEHRQQWGRHACMLCVYMPLMSANAHALFPAGAEDSDGDEPGRGGVQRLSTKGGDLSREQIQGLIDSGNSQRVSLELAAPKHAFPPRSPDPRWRCSRMWCASWV
jgi:hypothetical protein